MANIYFNTDPKLPLQWNWIVENVEMWIPLSGESSLRINEGIVEDIKIRLN